jgi:ribosome maturation factor RimP
MPIPSTERVTELVAEPVARRGLDLEELAVVPAGKHSVIRVVVDGDGGISLDDVAELSRELSEILDGEDFGETPYTLEVTTRGVDRPLTLERHWRRARGRKVALSIEAEEIEAEEFEGRIGEVSDGSVAIVVGGKREPTIRTVVLADIVKAVVLVEFSRPSPRELELTGLAPGTPAPAAPVSIDLEEADK